MNKYFDLFSKITPPELLYIIDGKKTIQIYNYKGGDFMSLKKTTLGVLMAMTMTVPASMTCNCLTASATTSSEVILRALYTKSCNSDLSISGTNAICKSIVIGYPDESSMNDLKKSTNSNNMSKITFVWGYNTEGDEYLKNAINIFGLKPMPNISNYYYSEAVDDYGVDIYQIYWSKDGYCFQLNIPSKIFNNFNNYRVNGIKSFYHSDLLDIEKTEYDIAAIAKELAKVK